MPKERILITVKTYPTLSRKYGETVCTAGIREDGSWVRIYPIPFRRLEEEDQYTKFDWIECDLIKAKNDPRPESRTPADVRQLRRVAHIDTSSNWRQRRNLLLGTAKVYANLETLIAEAKANTTSLAVFRPTKVIDFTVEEEEREWNETKLLEMRNRDLQGELFGEEAWRNTFQIIQKLPYSFSYTLEDAVGKRSTLQILDWEIGALYWNCLKRCGGEEKLALQKVRQKYYDEFLRSDLHFFLGTTQQFRFVGPNPWVIVGVFPIPHERQKELF